MLVGRPPLVGSIRPSDRSPRPISLEAEQTWLPTTDLIHAPRVWQRHGVPSAFRGARPAYRERLGRVGRDRLREGYSSAAGVRHDGARSPQALRGVTPATHESLLARGSDSGDRNRTVGIPRLVDLLGRLERAGAPRPAHKKVSRKTVHRVRQAMEEAATVVDGGQGFRESDDGSRWRGGGAHPPPQVLGGACYRAGRGAPARPAGSAVRQGRASRTCVTNHSRPPS